MLAALHSFGHQATVATSSREAEQAAESAPTIDLLIVDHAMPPNRGAIWQNAFRFGIRI